MGTPIYNQPCVLSDPTDVLSSSTHSYRKEKLLPRLEKIFNIFSTLFGTDINRRLSNLKQGCSCEIIHSKPSIGKGMYRVILLQKY